MRNRSNRIKYMLVLIFLFTYLLIVTKFFQLHFLLNHLSPLFSLLFFAILCILFHFLEELLIEVNHLSVHKLGEIIPCTESFCLLLLLSFELIINFKSFWTDVIFVGLLFFLSFVVLKTCKDAPLVHFVGESDVLVVTWRMSSTLHGRLNAIILI